MQLMEIRHCSEDLHSCSVFSECSVTFRKIMTPNHLTSQAHFLVLRAATEPIYGRCRCVMGAAYRISPWWIFAAVIGSLAV